MFRGTASDRTIYQLKADSPFRKKLRIIMMGALFQTLDKKKKKYILVWMFISLKNVQGRGQQDDSEGKGTCC